jgi:hypothetical protein
MNEQCNHKFKKLEESVFEWCKLCGTVVYHMKVGGIFKQTETGIYCNFRGQIIQDVFLNNHDFRAQHHNHEWFKLTSEYDWCKVCGALQLTKIFSPKGSMSVVSRKGVLLPFKKQARLNVLNEANLLEELHFKTEAARQSLLELVNS